MTETQTENRTERRAYCEADNVPESEIQSIFRRYPELYGIEARTETQESLL